MITAINIIPHLDHFSLVVTTQMNRYESKQVYAYIHPVDGAWVVSSLKGVPFMVCMDVLSLTRRIHARYGVVPSLPKKLTDFTR